MRGSEREGGRRQRGADMQTKMARHTAYNSEDLTQVMYKPYAAYYCSVSTGAYRTTMSVFSVSTTAC